MENNSRKESENGVGRVRVSKYVWVREVKRKFEVLFKVVKVWRVLEECWDRFKVGKGFGNWIKGFLNKNNLELYVLFVRIGDFFRGFLDNFFFKIVSVFGLYFLGNFGDLVRFFFFEED